jgi:preprotein translocase subunit SecE
MEWHGLFCQKGISFFTLVSTNNDQFFPNMEKITLYLKESYQELTKEVSWPTMAQLQESTLVVIVTALVLAMLIFVMDAFNSVIFKNLIYGV